MRWLNNAIGFRLERVYTQDHISKLSHLNHGVEEGDSIQSGLPLGHVSDIQLILSDPCVRPFQPWLNTLWRFVGELDRGLVTVTEDRNVESFS